MKINGLILTASLGLAAAPGAWADIIFNTTPGPSGTTINSDHLNAQSFKSGPTSSTFTDVVLRMSAGSPGGNFFVKLYDASGTGNLPGSFLQAFVGEANPAAAGSYTYTGSYGLAANTDYWIEAGVSSGSGTYAWLKSTAPPTAGTSTYGRAHYYYGWEGPWPGDNQAMQVNVEGAAVPEPGQWAMMGMTLAGVVGFLVRQRRAKGMTIAR